MKLYTFQQFCCGCQIKTGVLIIGIIYIIGAALDIANDGVGLVAVHSTTMLVLTILSIVLTVALLVASILLVLGAVKDNAQHLVPWLYMSLIDMAYFSLFNVIGVIDHFLDARFSVGIGIIFSLLILIALFVYFFLIVHTHYVNLQGGIKPAPVMLVATPV